MAAAASEAPAAAAVPVGGDEEDREHIGVIDMSEAARNLWLIKVPASLVKAWEDAPDGEELGVMRVYDELAPGQKKPTVEVDIAEPAAKRARSMTKSFVPCELELKWKDDGPALAVLSQTEETASSGGQVKVAIEGKVGTKADCIIRKGINVNAMLRQAVAAHQSTVSTIQDQAKIKRSFSLKGVKGNVRKTEAEKAKFYRKDEDEVKRMLFALFAKHEYYSFENLYKATQQPKPHLQAVLKTIAEYIRSGEHKHTWHLKEEFRHYAS